MKFEDVQPPLCEEVMNGIRDLGFTSMTPVQTATLPLFLTNKDVSVDACTGSGKTIAFIIPMVEMIKRRIVECKKKSSVCKLMGMAISPTRELARQIYDAAKYFCSRALPQVRVLLYVGGTSVEEDLDLIEKSKGKFCVVIGTPGRIEDILSRSIGNSLHVLDLEVLILDEADTLLDMGFDQSINHILKQLPKQRRTGLFSATQTREVKALARAGLRNPATVSVKASETNQKTPTTLENYYTFVSPDRKLCQLMKFIETRADKKIILFFSTCAAVDYFGRVIQYLSSKKLGDEAIECVSLHGKMVPKKRNANYDKFVAAKQGILICTDIVARGIDLPDVDWIVQYDPPQDPSFFVHRVGRTARAGRTGSALTFLSRIEDTYINFLSLRHIPMEEMELEDGEDVLPIVKQMAIDDRDILEKGTKAFIAFLRSYKEHQCQFIFRFKELDLGAVARGFALLRLPKINEFRRLDNVEFQPADVKIDEIAFKDKNREKQRLKQLKVIQQQRIVQKKDDAEKKQEKLKKLQALNSQAPRRREKKKGKQQQIVEEWEELAEEERLYKKLKKGKITEEEYEKALSGRNCSDSEEDGDEDDDDDECGGGKRTKKRNLSRMEKRFEKKPQKNFKTTEQKNEAKKREQRIKARKKRDAAQKSNKRRKM